MKVLALVAIILGAVMIYAGVFGRSLRAALAGRVQSA